MASTPLQLIEQATRHAAHLERLKSHEVKAFAEFLEQMQAQILRFLSRKELTEFSSRRLEDQLKAVRETLRQPLQDYRAVWREQIAELAKYEAGFEARSLDKVAANYQFSIPSDEQLRVAVFGNPLSARGASGGMLLDSFYQHFEDAQIDRLSNSLRMGYAQGRTNQQIAREALGLMQDDSRRAAEAITRTALQHAANQARAATWAANSDIVRKVRIVATLDDRTSIQCQSLDGQVFDIDKGPRPPFHVNCRTTTVAVLDDRFKVLDEGRTRSERDPETGKVGSVPAKQTYYGWLKGQSASVQDSIIGPTRGKLLRDGGLSAQRFSELQLGKNFEPLTLDQMRQLEPVAFQRAGV